MLLESPFELVHTFLIQYQSIGTPVIPCCDIAQYIWYIGKGRSTLAYGYVTPGGVLTVEHMVCVYCVCLSLMSL